MSVLKAVNHRRMTEEAEMANQVACKLGENMFSAAAYPHSSFSLVFVT